MLKPQLRRTCLVGYRVPLVPFPAQLPVTDSERVAVWADTAGIHVADDGAPVSAARTLRSSACVPAAIHDENLALDCGEGSVRLRDLASDVESEPAGAVNIEEDLAANYSANGEFFAVEGLGARLVAIAVSGKGGVLDLRYNLATGRRVGSYFLRSDKVPSLNSADGSSKLCSPLRVTTHRASQEYTGEIVREQDTYAVAGKRLLIRHGGQMRLYRCGSRQFQKLGRSTAMQPVINDRYAAWATRTTVYVRGFRSGTTRAFAVRDATGGAPTSIAELRGTERRLWIRDTQGVRLLDL